MILIVAVHFFRHAVHRVVVRPGTEVELVWHTDVTMQRQVVLVYTVVVRPGTEAELVWHTDVTMQCQVV